MTSRTPDLVTPADLWAAQQRINGLDTARSVLNVVRLAGVEMPAVAAAVQTSGETLLNMLERKAADGDTTALHPATATGHGLAYGIALGIMAARAADSRTADAGEAEAA